VQRGSTESCGKGCQFAAEVVEVSSEFVDSGEPTSQAVLGPPDVYPKKGYNKGAWAPLSRDDGEQYIVIAVDEPVYVTGFEIYETDHPGAVVRIEGRFDNNTAWTTVWSGEPSVPEGSSVYDVPTASFSTSARIFRPIPAGPREERLAQFKVVLDTAAASGYNQIDAIKVYGDGRDGTPVGFFEPVCEAIGQTDCWHVCRDVDVMDNARASALLGMLSNATAWVAEALKVSAAPGAALVLPYNSAQDANAQQCGDIPIPRALLEEGVHGSQVVIFATSRPSPEPLSVSACRYDESATSLGRPIAIHINIVPQYATAAVAAARADPVSDDVLVGATDAVIQYLYRGLGWAAEFHTSFLTSRGVSVVEERTQGCDSAEVCAAGWENRFLMVVSTPRLVEKAKDHFGIPTLSFVELENSGGAGVKGTLLEHRLFNGELMTLAPYVSHAAHSAEGGWAFPASGVRPMSKSAVSLGYLQDTGWYTPVYEVAEPLLWGYKQGLDFVLRQCNRWPATASNYVCPVSQQNGVFDAATPPDAPMCTADRVHVGTCSITNYPRPLQAPFQYFVRPQEGNLGGPSELADFCPLTVPEPAGFGAAAVSVVRDCRAGEDSSERPLQYFEEVGLASRCFVGERSRVKVTGCFKHACEGGVLFLKLEGVYKACPPEGGEVYFTESRMSLTCPRYEDVCHMYPASVPASVQIYSPSRDGERIETDAVVVLEISQFRIPEDGALVVTLGGVEHVRFTEDPSPGELVKTVRLQGLPSAAKQVAMAFELRDRRGATVFRAVRHVTIALFPPDAQGGDAGQYAAALAGFSSEYVKEGNPGFSRFAASALGPPDVPGYGSSSKAWSPERGGAGVEQLTFDVARPVFVYALEVYETFSPGALTRVLAYNEAAGSWDVIFRTTRESLPPPPLGSRVAPRVVPTRALDYAAKRLMVEFSTPSWVEVDAIKVLGYLATPRMFGEPEPLVVRVPFGTVANATLRVPSTGTSAVYWRAAQSAGSIPWLSLSADTGVVWPGDDELALAITVDATNPDALVQKATVRLTDIFALAGVDTLAVLEVTAIVDMTRAAKVAPPPCYHGLVMGASELEPGTCQCVPGASGQACEYLSCPRNCSSEVGGVLRGVCEGSSGRCRCSPGFTGLDCSGQDGDCYVSYDGFCRDGWERGSYIINAEDEGNMNKGEGSLPMRMQCSDDNPNGNTFGCSTYITLELCCRAAAAPECPFLIGAAPCAAPACEGVGEGAAGWQEVSPACRAEVDAYCFFALGDPACNWYKPIPPPTDFCPTGPALAYCAAHPEADACAPAVDPRPLCGFEAGASNPCTRAACEEDLFGAACRGLIEAHCAAVPDDRECNLHGLGNGCMFAAGSPPCDTVACYEGSYNEAACKAAIDLHCLGTAGPSDPECGAYGYGAPPPSATPRNTECLWDAARAQCALTPEADPCVLMRMYGVVEGQAPGGALPLVSLLQKGREAYAVESSAAFVEKGLELDRERRERVERHVLYRALFKHADADGDGLLGAVEVGTVVSDVVAAGSVNRPSFLNALGEEELAGALDVPGGFFGLVEFVEVLEGTYQSNN